jgi:hypothetical protein
MAIGDVVAVLLGTAAENYQPSSGVETRISATIKPATNDVIAVYDGSTQRNYFGADVISSGAGGDATQHTNADYNTCIMVDNSVYIRKPGSTDTVVITGVEMNS